ncbi:MAG TPA: site-specific integrase [Actinobacteria bacterium]|nr:site-specific integrase [Actinomycetes bacterium]HEX21230.1 site-specific integrase [Actinomycetota bacterium]
MARGSIIKRASGNYAIVFYVDGKQKWKTLPGATLKQAERALADIVGSVYEGTYQDKNIGFNELVDNWLESLKAQVKPSTLDFYQNISKQLVERFKSSNVRNITTLQVENYLATKIGHISNRTVGYHLTVARMIFKKAMIWGYCYKNPTDFIKKPRVEHKEVKILSADQVDTLLAAAQGQTRLLIITALLTGCRAGELMALRWQDIDLVAGVISITRNYVRGKISTPKSRGSYRQIVIPPLLVDELARVKAGKESDLIFTKSNGGPLDWSNFYNREFLPLLKRAGLPRVKFHSLRHTYASTLVASGEDLKFIQGQLGHSSLTMTLNTYSHLLPGKAIDAGRRIQAAFNINTTKLPKA